MKALIYKGPKSIEMQEIETPICGDNDIIVKNLYAGICGSDVAAYHHGGDDVLIFNGSEFGHEMVSEVVEVGKNVKGIEIGEIVYPYPGTAKDDPMRAATVGGFSEYVLIPNCQLNHSVFHVDPKISTKVAAMIEPFTVGARAAKLAEPSVEKKAIVFGAGIIGMSAAIALKHAGLEKIMVVDVSNFRLNKAKELGFEICNSSTENLKDKGTEVMGIVKSMFGEFLDVDIYIDATGIAAIPQTYQEFGKSGSILSVVGVHHQPREIDLMTLTYNQQKIVGSAGYDFDDVKTVMEIMKSEQFDLENLVSHEYDQEDLEEGILKASDANSSLKVLIKYV